MKLRHAAVALIALSVCSVAHAEMSVSTFLAKADALKAKGMMAMLSSDVGLLKTEMQTAVQSFKADDALAKQAGKPSVACVPAKTKLDSEEIIGFFRTIPAPQAPRISVKTGLSAMLAKRYPCPGKVH
ncbi:MAG: hypothetical protein RLZZ366_2137 [Pseudomonadota bacterium]